MNKIFIILGSLFLISYILQTIPLFLDAYEKQIDEKTEKANQESHKRDQQKIEQWCENHPESCVEGKPTVDILGGKSKKKSRKRNASKRRNRRTRRTHRTHNYKKK